MWRYYPRTSTDSQSQHCPPHAKNSFQVTLRLCIGSVGSIGEPTMGINDRSILLVAVGLILALALIPASTLGQSSVPDLNGLWDGAGNSSNLVQSMKAQGKEVPFTAHGAERYKKVDMAQNPNGFCLPPGPSRALTGPSPFQIVQSAGTVAILFENHFIYRLIYTDGTKHPDDIADYLAFMGHSIGHWEGDTLVVDT